MHVIRNLRTVAIVGMTAVSVAALASGPDRFLNGESYYGQPGRDGGNIRTVELGTAPHMNVGYGETVTFRSEGKQFSWTFNGLGGRSVDVAHIAPTGFLAKPFMVYVAPNPLNRN